MEALIVDDREVSRVSLARMMAHLGYRPIEVADAAGALALIRERPAISVVMLRSALSGYNLIAEMKSHQTLLSPPKLIVIGRDGDMPMLLKQLADGADEYIIKPYDRSTIDRKLRALGLNS